MRRLLLTACLTALATGCSEQPPDSPPCQSDGECQTGSYCGAAGRCVPPPANRSVVIEPPQINALTAGRSIALRAASAGGVNWSVEEADGGTFEVSPSTSVATWHAPALDPAAGDKSFHLVATSKLDPQQKASLALTVSPVPAIASFSAAPLIVTAGDAVSLSASFAGGTGAVTADTLSAQTAIQSGVPASIDAPLGTTTFTLTVKNTVGDAAGTVQASQHPAVTAVAGPATSGSFQVTYSLSNSNHITAGSTGGQLSFDIPLLSASVTSAEIRGGSQIYGTSDEIVAASGGRLSVPLELGAVVSAGTVTFTLTAVNAAGRSLDSPPMTTLEVVSAPLINSFSAQPTLLTDGDSTSFTATFANGDGTLRWSDQHAAIASQTALPIVPPTGTTTAFTLTVDDGVGDPAGSVQFPTSVSVRSVAAPLIPAGFDVVYSESGSSHLVTAGSDSGQLSFAIPLMTGATSASITDDLGHPYSDPATILGSKGSTLSVPIYAAELAATGTANFTLTVANDAGATATRSATLSVIAPPSTSGNAFAVAYSQSGSNLITAGSSGGSYAFTIPSLANEVTASISDGLGHAFSDSAGILGAAGSTLGNVAIEPTALAAAGIVSFTLTIKNQAGDSAGTVTSPAATLSVIAPPSLSGSAFAVQYSQSHSALITAGSSGGTYAFTIPSPANEVTASISDGLGHAFSDSAGILAAQGATLGNVPIVASAVAAPGSVSFVLTVRNQAGDSAGTVTSPAATLSVIAPPALSGSAFAVQYSQSHSALITAGSSSGTYAFTIPSLANEVTASISDGLGHALSNSAGILAAQGASLGNVPIVASAVAAPGTVFFVLTVQNQAGDSAGTVTSPAATLSVIAPPTIDSTFTASPLTVTDGNATSFSAQFSGASGAVSGAGFTTVAILSNAPLQAVPPAGAATSFTLTVANAAGDTAGTVQSAQHPVVTSVPPPVIGQGFDVKWTGSNSHQITSGSQPSDGTYTFTIPALSGGTSAQIADGSGCPPGNCYGSSAGILAASNGTLSGIALAPGAVGATGALTFHLTLTNAADTQDSKSASLSVIAPPSATSFTASPAIVTDGGLTTLTAVFSGASALVTGNNGFAARSILNNTPLQLTPPAGATTTFTLTVVNSAGDAAGTLQYPTTRTVQSVPAPVVPSITAASPVTASTAGRMASVAARAGMIYAWTITAGSLANAAGATSGGVNRVSYTPGGAGTLTLGCSEINAAGASSAPATKMVTVVAAPSTPFITAPAVVTPGASVSASVSANSGMTYQWSASGAQITAGNGTASITFVASVPGSLVLSAVEVNAAGDRSVAATNCPPVVLDGSQPAPGDVAVDAKNVYFSNHVGNVIQLPLSGGAATALGSGNNSCPCPTGIAVDGTTVYWGDDNYNTSATIRRAPISGSEQPLASGFAEDPGVLAIDATWVYWTSNGGYVFRAPKSGGAYSQVASSQNVPSGIAADGTYVYWSNSGSGQVIRALPDGGSPLVIAPGVGRPSRIATDGANVYWTDQQGTIGKAPLDGGGPVTTLVTGEAAPQDIAVDESSVYWTNFAPDGGVKKVPIAGGTVTTLASGAAVPFGSYGIAVDGRNVYYSSDNNSSSTTGSVLKVAKSCTAPYAPACAPSTGASDAGWTDVQPMLTGRQSFGAASIGGCIYAAGGLVGNGTIYSDLVESYDPAQNLWTPRQRMLEPRANHRLVRDGNLLYAVGGNFAGGGLAAPVEAYDPAADSWSVVSALPTPVSTPAVAEMGGLIYAAGGSGGSGTTTAVQIFDPADGGWSDSGVPLTRSNTLAPGASLNGQIYIVGGASGALVDKVEAFDGTQWIDKKGLPNANGDLALAVSGGLLYSVGGDSVGSGLFSYDPVLDAWNQTLPSLSHPRSYLEAGATSNGVIYAVGGNSSGVFAGVEAYWPKVPGWTARTAAPGNFLRTAGGVINGLLYAVGEVSGVAANSAYDPSQNTWTPLTPQPNAIVTSAAGVIGGKLYLAGGYLDGDSNQTKDTLQIYDPVANGWDTTKATMPTKRWGAPGAVINGRLYVAGGEQACSPCTPLNALEVYDPGADHWTALQPMPTARALAAAAAVAGRLYVVGGINASTDIYYGNLEVYDPVSNSWDTSRKPLPTRRAGLAAAAIDGILYVAGGNDDLTVYDEVDAYDPASDSWTVLAPAANRRHYGFAASLNGTLYFVGGIDQTGARTGATEAYAP